MKKYLPGILLFQTISVACITAHAQTTGPSKTTQSSQAVSDSNKVFTLGEVVVQSKRKDSVDAVTYKETERFQRPTISTALDLMPGIAQSNVGPRNESLVYLRGFSLRQVPVFIDGIPVYVPYNGYVDFAMFTTFNISQINVEKGDASVLYGPNTMGGVINIVTAKPAGKLDVYGAGGWLTGGNEGYINVGSQLKHFYIQADASRYDRDYFNLSKSFAPTKTQDAGDRDNSYSNVWRYGLKIGFTPNANNEFAIGFNHQDGSKGTPVYAGSDTLNSLLKSPRYWQWPAWNKQSVYFLSNSKLSGKSYIKTRAYYDQFINTLKSYDNDTYTTQTRPYAFTSYYNDFTVGANVEYGHYLSATNILKTAVFYKEDVHREWDAGQPIRRMSDNTYSAGISDEQTFNQNWFLQVGASFNNRGSIVAQNYNSQTGAITNFPSDDNSAVDVQGKLLYTAEPGRTFDLFASRMTRFATIQDRYSYSFGTELPNPGLNAEHAYNFGLTYNDITIKKVNLQGSLFYSLLGNVIQNVNDVAYDSATNENQSQEKNTGRGVFYGAEGAITYSIIKTLKIGGNYTFIERKNLDNPKILFTDVPKNKAIGWLQWDISRVSLLVNGEYDSYRYSMSYGAKVPGYFLTNANAYVTIDKWFKLQGGVNNIFDKNYALTEGYPEQGRNYFVKLIFSYQYL
jgi:iron complex outermembrane receptor protein